METYKIGVSIALANGVSPVLAIIGRDLLGLNPSIAAIEKNFGGWAKALGSVAGILAGTAIVGGLVKIADHGKELLDQQDKMQRNGIGMNEVLKLQKNYYDSIARAVPTSTVSDYLKTTNELRAVTGNTEEAGVLAVKAMKVDALLSNIMGHETHGEYYKLLRSEEMKGISTDPAKREQFTDQAYSYIAAFGGKLQARDYQSLARRGGAAFINMKPEAMGPLSVLTADLGGDATGTSMMTFQQLMTGATTMSKQQGQTWQQLGLLNMDKVQKTGFGGSRLQLGLGAIVGGQEHNGDLPGYIKDVLYPAIAKAAGDDPAKIEEIIGKIAPNRNANKMIHMFGQEGFQDQISKDLGLAGQVEGIDTAYNHFITRNPKGAQAGFNDQYKSMMESIGAPMMLAAIPVMKSVTDLFTSMGGLANAHPEAVKYIGEALAALGVGLVAIGGIALATLVSIPLAIGGFVVAVATLAALNWDAVKSGLKSVSDAFDAFFGFLTSLAGKINGLLPNAGWGPERDSAGRIKNPGLLDKYIWGDPSGKAIPQSFHPGAQPMKATPISLSLNLDGRTLARAVSEQQDSLYRYETSSAAFNGAGRYGT